MKLSVKNSFPVFFMILLMVAGNCSAQQYVYMPGVWKLKKVTPKLDTASSAKSNTATDTSVKTNTVAKGVDLAKIDSLVKNDTLVKIAYRTPNLKLALTDKVLAIKDPSGGTILECSYAYNQKMNTLHVTCGKEIVDYKVLQINKNLKITDTNNKVTLTVKRKK